MKCAPGPASSGRSPTSPTRLPGAPNPEHKPRRHCRNIATRIQPGIWKDAGFRAAPPMTDAGGVYRRCGCADPATGRQLGGNCPHLADDNHGSWYIQLELPAALDGVPAANPPRRLSLARHRQGRAGWPADTRAGRSARRPPDGGDWLAYWLVSRTSYISVVPELARDAAEKIAALILEAGCLIPGTRKRRRHDTGRAKGGRNTRRPPGRRSRAHPARQLGRPRRRDRAGPRRRWLATCAPRALRGTRASSPTLEGS
jgi:hypothetical protein